MSYCNDRYLGQCIYDSTYGAWRIYGSVAQQCIVGFRGYPEEYEACIALPQYHTLWTELKPLIDQWEEEHAIKLAVTHVGSPKKQIG